MFGRLKEKLTGGVSRLSGKSDLLEGIAASCALVAAADGELEDSEAETTLNALLNHETLSKAFSASEIERITDAMFKKVKQGMSGRLGLYREIEQAKAKSTVEDTEMMLVIAIDVSLADGEVEPAERWVLDKIATSLGLNLRHYLDA